MTTIENRLRDALTATAALVAPSPAVLADERTSTVPGGVSGRRAGSRSLVPLVAAVLVLVVIGATFVITHRGERVSLVPASSPASHFVANVAGGGILEVSVRDARTGSVTATVPPPRGIFFNAVTATADPRVFFVLANNSTENVLFRLTVDATGSQADLAEVPNIHPPALSLAASPDGTRIAFPAADVAATGPGPARPAPAQIDVVTLASGELETFRADQPGHVTSPSWDASGRHLAFQLDSSNGQDGIRILDTQAGHDLIANSHRVVGWQPTFVGEFVSPMLSADGERVYAIAAQQAEDETRVTRVVELDAHTGEQLRILFEQPYADHGNAQWSFTQMARDPSGSQLLVVDGNGSCYRIDIATAAATRFPFPRGVNPNSIAW